MAFSPLSYESNQTFWSRYDVRLKLLLLLVFSICTLLVQQWIGLGCLVAFVVVGLILGRLPLAMLFKLSIPLVILLGCIWLFNTWAISFESAEDAFPLSFVFKQEQSLSMAFYCVKILAIFFAGYITIYSVNPDMLLAGLRSLLQPLRYVRVPVEDVATMLSLVLRFIPLTSEQLQQIKLAQTARGAQFSSGSLFARIKVWISVLVPLFTSLFRRADTMAEAMEARGYGARPERSSLLVLQRSYGQLIGFVVIALVWIAITWLL